ncbi:MAG TPA: tetratricopeptide repeat protein, partial [Candidatus Limnocylindrales bacterium]|nr:tetratricopeptide repeat protein [Candidatus Limnocylindrales bacterium]
LGLGAAAFNGGDSTAAEAAWKKVVAIDPKSVEAHYDLGLLYLNLNDLVSVKREWELVVQLDPGSDVAKNVQDHLDAIAAQASPGVGSSSSPAAPPAVPSGSARP